MTKTPSPSRPREIVIVGGGLIGVSTAYHLSRHPDLPPESRITLVEENNVGTGSSGYASGLLVRNQDDELSTIGFDLHKTLARDYGGELKWGYKPIDFYNATLNPSNTSTSNGHPSSSPSVPFLPSTAQIDHPHPHSPNTTAIINPSELTRHLCGLFLTHPGGSLRIARATSLTFDNQKSSRRVVNGINIVQIINSIEEIVHLRADTIVLCTGIKTPSLLGTFLGGEVPGLDVGRRDWEGLVLKTKQKHRPCAVMIRHNQEEEEGAGEVTLVVRDDGKIMVSRPIPTTTNNSPSFLKYIESLSPTFSSSSGTLILSQTQWSAPLTPDDKPFVGDLSDIASEMDVDGIWLGVGGDTTQGPAIGLKLSRSILQK